MSSYEKDEFGQRMKAYEVANRTFVDGKKPVYMRLDGRSFSKFTKNMVSNGYIEKPRDAKFEQVFVSAVIAVVEEFHFSLGFHQSDEISLFFRPVEEHGSLLFDGNVQKLTSVVTSSFTSAFIKKFYETYGFIPHISFDARVVEFPSKEEAANMLVWRYHDARRNLIQDIAHHQFGHTALHKVTTREKYKMIGEPVLSPGNFIKAVQYDKGEGIIRSVVKPIIVDIANMNFPERVNLVFDKYFEEGIVQNGN